MRDADKKREQDRAYYDANKDRCRERQREYRAANKERLRAADQAYREKDIAGYRKKQRESSRRYREANREQCRERVKAYRKDPANKAKIAKKNSRWWKSNPEKAHEYNLKRYGISAADFDALLAKQNRECAVCYSSSPGGGKARWHVDHCHETTRVRGLLCHHCNLGIGLFADDPTILEQAIKYLTRL